MEENVNNRHAVQDSRRFFWWECNDPDAGETELRSLIQATWLLTDWWHGNLLHPAHWLGPQTGEGNRAVAPLPKFSQHFESVKNFLVVRYKLRTRYFSRKFKTRYFSRKFKTRSFSRKFSWSRSWCRPNDLLNLQRFAGWSIRSHNAWQWNFKLRLLKHDTPSQRLRWKKEVDALVCRLRGDLFVFEPFFHCLSPPLSRLSWRLPSACDTDAIWRQNKSTAVFCRPVHSNLFHCNQRFTQQKTFCSFQPGVRCWIS